MKLAIGIAALGLLVSSCETTTGFSNEPSFVMVKTEPNDATITFVNGTSCETPCRVGVIDEVPLTIARTGYKAHRMVLTRKTKKSILVKLERTVVETELEAVELPDLQ